MFAQQVECDNITPQHNLINSVGVPKSKTLKSKEVSMLSRPIGHVKTSNGKKRQKNLKKDTEKSNFAI